MREINNSAIIGKVIRSMNMPVLTGLYLATGLSQVDADGRELKCLYNLGKELTSLTASSLSVIHGSIAFR